MTTHYETLGLPPAAPFAELRARYLELAKERHPDTNPERSTEFSKITAAYAVLKNAIKRREYDARLKMEGRLCAACEGRGTNWRKQPCLPCRGRGLK